MRFSHRAHAALKIECSHCHAGARSGERALLPAAAQCMVCHRATKTDSPAIRKLAALPADSRPFAHKAALPDFVFFSHARHAKADVGCSSCHATAATADQPEIHAKMKFCVDCHKEKRASAACNICHELSQ